MNLSEFDVANPHTMTVVSSDRLTPAGDDVEVRHLVLRFGDSDFVYQEGQSIGILAPGPHEFGNRNHLRLYSIANTRGEERGTEAISICVRRCFYIDEISGEKYPGKASNYLCDAKPGDQIVVTGPYGTHFGMPPETSCNMLMVGVGTGIAPFRAFIRRIHLERGGWKGKVRLFYGAKTGTEMLYVNDLKKDLSLYYDEGTFKAFEAVSPHPYFDDPPAIDQLIGDNADEVWSMILNPKTFVYVAGLTEAAVRFEKAMIAHAPADISWSAVKHELIASGRYNELLYQ